MVHVDKRLHSFTGQPYICPQMEGAVPALTPQPQSIIALWIVLISGPTEGRRLS